VTQCGPLFPPTFDSPEHSRPFYAVSVGQHALKRFADPVELFERAAD
jgi:hypothetical protein